MFQKRIFVLFVISTLLTLQSQAANWSVEPFLGYRSETIKLTDLTSQLIQIKGSAPHFGLRVGVRTMIGVEAHLGYDYFSGQAEVSGLSEKIKFNHSTASAQLGVSALGVMKIFLGYGFLNEFKTQDHPLQNKFSLSGPVYLAGLQFKLFPWTYIGLQYNLNQYNKIKGVDFTNGESLDSYFSKSDSQDFSVFLSVTL